MAKVTLLPAFAANGDAGLRDGIDTPNSFLAVLRTYLPRAIFGGPLGLTPEV